MVKFVVPASIENAADSSEVRRGTLHVDRVRRVAVEDAVVDGEVSGLLLPSRIVVALGLAPMQNRPPHTVDVLRVVRLTLQGRDCIMDVIEVTDDNPVTIGSVPLLAMDWVIDMRGHKLVGNPDHGGVQMMDII